MKSQEIKERLEKAEATVEKRAATIERHKARAEKLLGKLRAKGWEPNRDLYRGGSNDEAYWLVCDYENALDDIEGATDKLEEAKRIAQNWKDRLDKQVELETKIAFEMPEIFSQLRDELAEEWTRYDIERRDFLKAKYRELGYREFLNQYKGAGYRQKDETDEQIRKDNERSAELFIVDLYNRVKAVTGEVTNWGNIHYGGKALNGWVEGVQGKARVESILAGGYNIQRLHIRVLVHEM